jgi:peptidoglycan/xylan/chitin deacetylase (PgdA/CDA1 family)
LGCSPDYGEPVGQTTLTKWPQDKSAAISVTYDDGIINQFTVARPIMNELGLPATFYVITGKLPDAGQGQFIGRPAAEIIAETATIPTDSTNLFERASLIAFTGTDEAVDYHSRAGSRYEAGRVEEAYAIIDEAYRKLRAGELKNTGAVVFHDNAIDTTTWEDLRAYAAEGHEIASHSVTHPRLAVLDEANLRYELEQSKADIARHLGPHYTFTAECPYGTEDERVMGYAHKIYPALRNRMPEPWLAELNRSSRAQPGAQPAEYVQWQRGPLTDTRMETMQGWVDTLLAHDNIWLVLVFHGVDGVGWEPKTGAELREFFTYVKEREDRLWVATFATATKFLRARQSATVASEIESGQITVRVSTPLDLAVYDVPLTAKTYVPDDWSAVSRLTPGDQAGSALLEIAQDSLGKYVLYSVVPNGEEVRLQGN